MGGMGGMGGMPGGTAQGLANGAPMGSQNSLTSGLTGGLTNGMRHPPAMGNEVLPQRESEPDCIYFLRNGRCKYGVTCKYHHPLNGRRRAVSSDSTGPGYPHQYAYVNGQPMLVSTTSEGNSSHLVMHHHGAHHPGHPHHHPAQHQYNSQYTHYYDHYGDNGGYEGGYDQGGGYDGGQYDGVQYDQSYNEQHQQHPQNPQNPQQHHQHQQYGQQQPQTEPLHERDHKQGLSGNSPHFQPQHPHGHPPPHPQTVSVPGPAYDKSTYQQSYHQKAYDQNPYSDVGDNQWPSESASLSTASLTNTFTNSSTNSSSSSYSEVNGFTSGTWASNKFSTASIRSTASISSHGGSSNDNSPTFSPASGPINALDSAWGVPSALGARRGSRSGDGGELTPVTSNATTDNESWGQHPPSVVSSSTTSSAQSSAQSTSAKEGEQPFDESLDIMTTALLDILDFGGAGPGGGDKGSLQQQQIQTSFQYRQAVGGANMILPGAAVGGPPQPPTRTSSAGHPPPHPGIMLSRDDMAARFQQQQQAQQEAQQQQKPLQQVNAWNQGGPDLSQQSF
jgi:hypothetical protein